MNKKEKDVYEGLGDNKKGVQLTIEKRIFEPK